MRKRSRGGNIKRQRILATNKKKWCRKGANVSVHAFVRFKRRCDVHVMSAGQVKDPRGRKHNDGAACAWDVVMRLLLVAGTGKCVRSVILRTCVCAWVCARHGASHTFFEILSVRSGVCGSSRSDGPISTTGPAPRASAAMSSALAAVVFASRFGVQEVATGGEPLARCRRVLEQPREQAFCLASGRVIGPARCANAERARVTPRSSSDEMVRAARVLLRKDHPQQAPQPHANSDPNDGPER